MSVYEGLESVQRLWERGRISVAERNQMQMELIIGKKQKRDY